jgi:cobalt-zinc-cadmium efflux system outer membrane protein
MDTVQTIDQITGNVTGNELLRLQTALFAVNGEMNEVRTEYNAHQKNIKNLLALEPSVVVIVAEEQVDFPSPLTLDPAMLMETALASRPDLAAAVLRAEYHRKDIVYQKALAIPDISLGVKYDRAGGVWDNFFGVGIGVQLPVFNRNKGAIRSARFRLRQNEILVLQERNNIRNEIIECLENYKAVYSFLEENGVNRSIQSEMDKMPDVYTKNLLMKNISMVEYMDFMDSYIKVHNRIFFSNNTIITNERRDKLLGKEIPVT